MDHPRLRAIRPSVVTALVIGASVALAWGLPDETSPYADAALIAIEKGVMHVPELWPYEIANGLVIAHRRQRITSEDEQMFVAAISRLTHSHGAHGCAHRYTAGDGLRHPA